LLICEGVPADTVPPLKSGLLAGKTPAGQLNTPGLPADMDPAGPSELEVEGMMAVLLFQVAGGHAQPTRATPARTSAAQHAQPRPASMSYRNPATDARILCGDVSRPGRQSRAGGHLPAAFGALVTPHVTDLTRLCRRVAGPALADDCVQDTLLLALLRLQSLREPGLFENWLRGIAIRVCRRTRARLAPHAPLPAEDEQLGTWLLGSGPAPSLDETLVGADLVRSVRSAVADLPTGQRRAVEMFYLRGLSYEEAAGELAIPVGALKTRLHKARAALARHYRLDDGAHDIAAQAWAAWEAAVCWDDEYSVKRLAEVRAV
jgi:RNA polymerase sigma-70 factor, ECF subfamily